MYIKKRGKRKDAAASDAVAGSSVSGVSPSSPTTSSVSSTSNSASVSSSNPTPKSIIIDEHDFDHRVGSYQLMEPIGKGGYGTVYRGLNILSGVTVAVKRVPLMGVPPDELESIEMEIKLLQNLSHPNIVKYHDSIRTENHLNIVLEYVENGSLSGLMAKFGTPFPETLVALYIAQTLKGLHYLHQQGVIHRDIKGANILSTKEGVVKLADFGVATKLNESRKSDSVVGSPYWIAPEIIEMTGQQSSACDIWSVGCTAVELLTGKPPYFDLAQMPALFRIVQDEHPPLPDGIGPAMEDFLMLCWQKDPNRRIDAAGLLKHPWLKKALEQDSGSSIPANIPAKPAQQPTQQPSKAHESSDDEEDWDAEIAAEEEKLTGGVLTSIASPKQPSSPIGKGKDDMEDDPFADMDDDDDLPPKRNVASPAPGSSATKAAPPRKPQIENFTEKGDEEEDYGVEEDDLEDLSLDAALKPVKPNKSQAVASDDEEEDPFNEIEFDEESAAQDEDLIVSKTFMRLIGQLQPLNDEKTVLEACEKLNELNAKSPAQLQNLMTLHGVIPIMEMLEVQNTTVLHAVLSVVNQIVGKNQKFQQSLSLAGLIPAIIRFGSRSFTMEIRMQAASFVRQFCYASDFSRKMFIACDGLPVLVSFLQEEYAHSRTLVWNALDCIRHVFDITTSPRNDFCRLFCKLGLLEPLTKVLLSINSDRNAAEAPEYVNKITKILHLFSQGDKVVKTHFAKPGVLDSMLKVLPSLRQEGLILVLKSLTNIAMEPQTLDLLEAAGAIPALMPFLNSPLPENQHQVLLSMYYFCQLKASRQEQAAIHGIIPHLQRFVKTDHPLKQFAFPILFQLAKTSARSRIELKKCAGIQFYLDTLRDAYWRSHGLEVLANWLQEEPIRVGFILNTTNHINQLYSVFQTTNDAIQFEKMLPLFRKMLSVSIRVNQSFGRHQPFLAELKQRMQRHANSNNIRINLLKILALIVVAHPDPVRLANEHKLLPMLSGLTEEKASVIVVSLAQKLLDKFKQLGATA